MDVCRDVGGWYAVVYTASRCGGNGDSKRYGNDMQRIANTAGMKSINGCMPMHGLAGMELCEPGRGGGNRTER